VCRWCGESHVLTTLIRHALLIATHPAGAVGSKHAALARRIQKGETDY